jgi:hypothetical protein
LGGISGSGGGVGQDGSEQRRRCCEALAVTIRRGTHTTPDRPCGHACLLSSPLLTHHSPSSPSSLLAFCCAATTAQTSGGSSSPTAPCAGAGRPSAWIRVGAGRQTGPSCSCGPATARPLRSGSSTRPAACTPTTRPTWCARGGVAAKALSHGCPLRAEKLWPAKGARRTARRAGSRPPSSRPPSSGPPSCPLLLLMGSGRCVRPPCCLLAPQCMDIPGNNVVNQAGLQLWTCNRERTCGGGGGPRERARHGARRA